MRPLRREVPNRSNALRIKRNSGVKNDRTITT